MATAQTTGHANRIISYAVAVTEPGSAGTFKYTITDTANTLTTSKMVRSVLLDGFDQWRDANKTALDTDYVALGNITNVEYLEFTFENKYTNLDLTANTNYVHLGVADVTATSPFADV